MQKELPHGYTVPRQISLEPPNILKSLLPDIFGEKFGRTPTRTGLKERFPQLRVDKYLVVKPEIVGPNFKEFTKLYNEIFAIGK